MLTFLGFPLSGQASTSQQSNSGNLETTNSSNSSGNTSDNNTTNTSSRRLGDDVEFDFD